MIVCKNQIRSEFWCDNKVVQMYNMIGYDEHGNAKKLSYIRTGMAGAASGCVTRFICQPLDVIKIVFQVSVQFFCSIVLFQFPNH